MKRQRLEIRQSHLLWFVFLIALTLSAGGLTALTAQTADTPPIDSDNNQTAWTQNQQGLALLKDGALSEAVELFQRAIELQPDFTAAYYNLGATYNALDRPAEAAELLEHALQIRSDAETYSVLGLAYRKLHKNTAALHSYQKAVLLNPRLAEAYNGLGLVYRALGKHERAANAFQVALQLQPGYAIAYNNLGVEQAEMRHYRQALATFEQALAINHSFADVRFNLGAMYLRMKRHDAAVAQWQLLKRLDPELADKLYAGIYQGKILKVTAK